MAYHDGHEHVGLNLHVPFHVWLAKWRWLGSCEVLAGAPHGSLGHSIVLPVWGCWTELHFSYNQPIRCSHQHNHHYHAQVCEYSGIFSVEWKPSVITAMGGCGHGLQWSFVSNLLEVDKEEFSQEEE